MTMSFLVNVKDQCIKSLIFSFFFRFFTLLVSPLFLGYQSSAWSCTAGTVTIYGAMYDANNYTTWYLTYAATYSPTLTVADLAGASPTSVRKESWTGTVAILSDWAWSFPYMYNGSWYTRRGTTSAKTRKCYYFSIFEYQSGSTMHTTALSATSEIIRATSTDHYIRWGYINY